ncbi:MAG TPA: HDOD domain-containing protein [Kofleriaceae bacterium]|nr:HDOD domain-containing protein [Kofleriaceae bacterium]
MVAEARIGCELERIVLARIASDKLVLPAMPAAATRCLELLRDPCYQQHRVIATLESDPLLAASVLHAASTAAAGGTATRLDQAIGRLGAERLQQAVIEYAAHQLFRSSNPRIAAANRKVWQHSVAVALLARELATPSGCDGDAAYLAGLLHDLGKPVIAAMLLEAERQLGQRTRWLDDAGWTRIVESAHRKVGVAIAAKWQLPEDVAAAIADCSDYDPAHRTGVANVVRLANAIAKREGYATGAVDRADLDAMIMVGQSMIGADDAIVARLAAGVAEKVGQLR